MNIKSITIKGLFGDRNYRIRLKKNRLVLVAENGSGKTTIVNIIYYFLSGQWTKLLKYDFKYIEVRFNEVSIKVNKSEIDITSSKRFDNLFKRYPDRIKDAFLELMNTIDIAEYSNSRVKLRRLSESYNLPTSLLYELLNAAEKEQYDLFESTLIEKRKLLDQQIKSQILYLPTYRRIEQDLRTILPDLDEELGKYNQKRMRGLYKNRPVNDSYIELVEFGMEDVKQKIREKLTSIENEFNDDLKNGVTGTYLKDILSENYKDINYSNLRIFDQENFKGILSRVKDSVLSKTEKQRLSEFVAKFAASKSIERNENKIIAYFIYRLSQIYERLKEKEQDVISFINICNDYSSNKVFHYDNISFQISIHPRNRNGEVELDKSIKLGDLSSGEKQIVSLFSHLYLSDIKDFIIIIDEPELSLSVPWQERFLVDIHRESTCKGLIAVTHSPFIFENEMEEFARGLNIFEEV